MYHHSIRHQELLDELVEWWEDLSDDRINSRALVLSAPHGWGCSTIFDRLEESINDPDSPVTLVIRVNSRELMPGHAFQADELSKILTQPKVESRIASLLDLNATAGRIQLGLGLSGLLASGLAAAASLLVASLAVTAAGNAWNATVAGEEGSVARAARALAAISVSIPTVVIIDDADALHGDLAVAMVTNLINRHDSRILAILRTNPQSHLMRTLDEIPQYKLGGAILAISCDTSSDYQHRKELAFQVCPQLPAVVVERIGRRTQTFGDVFAVMAHSDRLTELGQDVGAISLSSLVDPVIDASLDQERPPFDAVVLAWAGGILHENQMARIIDAFRLQQQENKYIIKSASLYRLVDPVSNTFAPGVAALSTDVRKKMAAILLEEASKIAASPGVGIIDCLVARQAVHNVRDDVVDQTSLGKVQLALIRGLESLHDPNAAFEVAKAALDSLDTANQAGAERVILLGALLRLAAKVSPTNETEPLIRGVIEQAAVSGAAFGLEARIWGAVDLLDRGIPSKIAYAFIEEIVSELEGQSDLGPLGDQWRLVLGFRIGRAGWPTLSQRLLGRIIKMGSTPMREAAQAVIYAAGGPQADLRLQTVFLEEELQAVDRNDIESLYRIRKTLRSDYSVLGNWDRALDNCQEELALSLRLYGKHHLAVLRAREREAGLTGKTGDVRRARRLIEAVVPDMIRIIGRDTAETLQARSELAEFTGEDGEPGRARDMLKDLVRESARSMGARSVATLTIRGDLAEWTGADGELQIAKRQLEELVPEMVDVLGSRHPETLRVRMLLAHWTFTLGDPERSLYLNEKLLPDMIVGLGPDHPDTMLTRDNISHGSANMPKLKSDFEKLAKFDPDGSAWAARIREIRRARNSDEP